MTNFDVIIIVAGFNSVSTKIHTITLIKVQKHFALLNI